MKVMEADKVMEFIEMLRTSDRFNDDKMELGRVIMKSLMQMLLEVGYPREQMFCHESDLYVFVTPLTEKVITEWCKVNEFERILFCSTFKDQITGRPMYDCAFQYKPWWEERCGIPTCRPMLN